MTRNAELIRERTAVSQRHRGLTLSSILVWTIALGGGCAEVQATPCQGGEVREGGECVCPAGQSLTNGMCLAEDDPCVGLDCSDGNDCTDDTCVVVGDEATCPFSPLDDGTACNGNAGTCMDGQCEATSALCRDIDCDDQNPCTMDGVCNAATGLCPKKTFEPIDTVCDADGVCDGEGNCVACTQSAESCSDGNECTKDVCADGVCTNPTSDGGPCNLMPGDGVCMGGMCEEIPPACQGVNCDDSNECTDDGSCNPANGFCDNRSNEPLNTACSQDGGSFCDGQGNCVVCTNPGHCDDRNDCTANTCVEGMCASAPVSDGTSCHGGADMCEAGRCVARKTISVGCTANVFSGAVSIIDWELSVVPDGAVIGGEEFNATVDGTAFFSEGVLDELTLLIPSGFKRAAVLDLAASVSVRSGATGDVVTLRSVDLPSNCQLDGASCDPNKNQPDGANEDCVPTGSFNWCVALVDVPTIDGIPLSAGGCEPPPGGTPPDCDCWPCEVLDATLSFVKTNQCERNGFCVSGPLPLELEAVTGTYTANASGEILFGWDDQNTGATVGNDGTYMLPAAIYGDTAAPNGIRLLLLESIFPAHQCTMAVDSGDPVHGVGVPDQASPTPDALLLSIPIAD